MLHISCSKHLLQGISNKHTKKNRE